MSKAGKNHMDAVRELGCIVCKREGLGFTPASAHHINCRTMGRKASDFETIPLCPTHHQTGGMGVAVHAGKRTWERIYGTEAELLEHTRTLLEMQEVR